MSTVVQFRVIDWGMERCRLILNVPAANSTAYHGGAEDPAENIDVWALEHQDQPELFSRPDSVLKLTRTHLIAKFKTAPGHKESSPIFDCASASNVNVELACSPGRSCDFDFYYRGTKHTSTLQSFIYYSKLKLTNYCEVFYIEQMQSI
jgi:hypothetical protein